MNDFNLNKLDSITTQNQDFKGRRIVNAGDSIDKQDYITQKELTDATNSSVLTNLVLRVIGGLSKFVLSVLSPPVDGLTALVVTRADQKTRILTFDTTNKRVNLGGVLAPTELLTLEVAAAATGLSLKEATTGNYVAYLVGSSATGDNGKLVLESGGVVKVTVDAAGASTFNGGNVLISQNVGFFGAAAAAQQTLSAYVSNNQNVAYTGLATGVAGTPYASLVDLNALRVAYQNLKVSYDDLQTKIRTTTLVA